MFIEVQWPVERHLYISHDYSATQRMDKCWVVREIEGRLDRVALTNVQASTATKAESNLEIWHMKMFVTTIAYWDYNF